MTFTHYANLNEICNERCVFCAAGMANGPRPVPGRPKGITLADVQLWTERNPICPGDEVRLAGGEPTLHPELVPIVKHLADAGARVTVFTNGLRLASESYAHKVLNAGVTRFDIGFFGATAETHEAITQRKGSFERTITALNVLGDLKDEYDFHVEIRLLVARQCYRNNPDIIRLLAERVRGVDSVSINRLQMVADAIPSDAGVSWGEAREAINETARLICENGYGIIYGPVPLCIYDDDTLRLVRKHGVMIDPPSRDLHLLDSRLAVAGQPTIHPRHFPRAKPQPCQDCALFDQCGGVDWWHAERYGEGGIHPRSAEWRVDPEVA
jgi:MoaA/NifB/PqqE/SkfB family radical SAM enzyme